MFRQDLFITHECLDFFNTRDSDWFRSHLVPLLGGYRSTGGRAEKLTTLPHIVPTTRTIVLYLHSAIQLYGFHRDIILLLV
jgi:hypothetical protein